jgi:hypothetical protein
MTTIRAFPADRKIFDVLSAALELQIPPNGNLEVTVIASIVRRLAAVMAPCTRAALLRSSSLACGTCLDHMSEDALHQAVEDLVAGGDLREEPALLEGDSEAPNLVFCRQPSFCQSGQRVYLLGAAPDDAPFLPATLMQAIISDGGLRYFALNEDTSLCETLRKMGLHELSVDHWLAQHIMPPGELIEKMRAILASRGRRDNLVSVRWLTSSEARYSYQERWREETNEQGLLIARAPQPYGEDAWYLAERSGDNTRFLQLPLEEFPNDRACDLAWRVQLALDALSDRSSRYQVTMGDDVATLVVNFPVPALERRTLLHLGGRRDTTTSAFRYTFPSGSLQAAEAILRNINFVSTGRPI